ncbi:MAG: cell shape determination protein CcmA, partial [Solirubrobacterales bacterium]|nr:cell shape determination protein CcmA [Solirubrobacterales bacterium]
GLLLALGWFIGDPPAIAALPPTVTGVAPNHGPEAGGTEVIITGTEFTGATAVDFGNGKPTASFSVESATSIRAVSPVAPEPGEVDVKVTNPEGASTKSSLDQFTFVPAPTVSHVEPGEGPEGGGTAVTITGTNFSGASSVEFGKGKPAASFSVESATSIKATSPAAVKPGVVHVTVTTSGGASAETAADQFRFVPVPAVTRVEPSEGPEAGGTTVTITGTNLTGATAVRFGAAEATGVAVNGEGTQITAASPSGSGTVDVTVTTPGGTSATASPDRFSYVPPAIVVPLPPSGSSLAPSSPPVVVVVPPSPAPVPKKGAVVCTLKVDHVHLPGKTPSARKKAKPRAGTLTVIMTCDQAASVTLRGQLIQPIGRPKHGKQHTKRLPFGFATASVKAGVPKALTLRLPKPAVVGLEHRKAQKISFTIVTKPVTATT